MTWIKIWAVIGCLIILFNEFDYEHGSPRQRFRMTESGFESRSCHLRLRLQLICQQPAAVTAAFTAAASLALSKTFSAVMSVLIRVIDWRTEAEKWAWTLIFLSQLFTYATAHNSFQYFNHTTFLQLTFSYTSLSNDLSTFCDSSLSRLHIVKQFLLKSPTPEDMSVTFGHIIAHNKKGTIKQERGHNKHS